MASKQVYSILITVFLLACSGSKRMLRDAATLEKGGLRKEAFEQYGSIYRTTQRPEAIVGMKRVGQAILEDRLQKAAMACMSQNYELAISSYDEAFAFAASYPEIELTISSMVLDRYASCRSEYVSSMYDQAESAVLGERYDEGKALIQKILSIDRSNKKAEYLNLIIDILPNYNLGKKAFEMELYRDAYIYFNEVTKLDAGYKDALALRDESLNKSKYTIAYVKLGNEAIDDALEVAVSTTIKSEILNLRDPFIQLVDRENLEQMLKEQQNSMTGLFDEKTVIQAGKLTGARYIITGEMVTYEPVVASQRSYEKKAYLGASENAKKVRYVENRLGRGLDASFRYQILDAQTGRVYASAIVPFSDRDNVVWAEFQGDYEMLYPGDWKWQLISSQEDIVRPDEHDELMKLFTGRKGPISEMEMRQRMLSSLGRQIAEAVKEFRPEK